MKIVLLSFCYLIWYFAHGNIELETRIYDHGMIPSSSCKHRFSESLAGALSETYGRLVGGGCSHLVGDLLNRGRFPKSKSNLNVEG